MGNKKSDQRLRSRSDFEKLKEFGKKLSVRRWFVAVYNRRPDGNLRYGFTITRKVGGAVERNRLKRWGRECFRRSKDLTSLPVDINIIIRPMSEGFFDKMTFQEFGDIFDQTLSPILKIRSKPASVSRENSRADL